MQVLELSVVWYFLVVSGCKQENYPQILKNGRDFISPSFAVDILFPLGWCKYSEFFFAIFSNASSHRKEEPGHGGVVGA